MSDLKAKMHQIRFRLALRPTPRWGAYIASPDPLVRFKGPTSKRREGRGEEGRGGLPPFGGFWNLDPPVFSPLIIPPFTDSALKLTTSMGLAHAESPIWVHSSTSFSFLSSPSFTHFPSTTYLHVHSP